MPYGRYGETIEGVLAQISTIQKTMETNPARDRLQDLLGAGAARNALDCALWDLEAKTTDEPAWKIAGLTKPQAVTTAFTISLGTPAHMAAAARQASHMPVLKLKLGAPGDQDRLTAIRQAVPGTRLVVDANEGWTADELPSLLSVCRDVGIELIEQPLPADSDRILADIDRTVPICADESIHDLSSLPPLLDRYDAINIKLDKTGGLTEAIRLSDAARTADKKIMIGCMVSTSLGIAPALLLTRNAAFVDLDGPLLLARDRAPGLVFKGAQIQPETRDLWG